MPVALTDPPRPGAEEGWLLGGVPVHPAMGLDTPSQDSAVFSLAPWASLPVCSGSPPNTPRQPNVLSTTFWD